MFIQANARQRIGAIVAEYAIRRHFRGPGRLVITPMYYEDYPFFRARDGQEYRGHITLRWDSGDLQCFTPLRFAPPRLTGYRGRALVIDPDVFALTDISPLFGRDMDGAAILACWQKGGLTRRGRWASSVMLLDCEKLRHWDFERDFGELFTFRRNYADWVGLACEPPGTVRPLEPEWNHLDTLRPGTRMLHMTRRATQPWKTGLPVDYVRKRHHTPAFFDAMMEKAGLGGSLGRLNNLFQPRFYLENPDPAQTDLFFDLLAGCLEEGLVTEQELREEMRRNHLRHDTPDILAARRQACAVAAP